MHANSINAYHQERNKFSKRLLMVVAWFELNGKATDRQCMHGLGFKEPNCVRPRITEAIELGMLEEVGTVQCQETRINVRVVARPAKQMELLAA